MGGVGPITYLPSTQLIQESKKGPTSLVESSVLVHSDCSECCGTSRINTSHIFPPAGQYINVKSRGQDSTHNYLRITLMLHIWIPLCFHSTKLLILPQNKDGGTSLQHTNIPGHKFAGGCITLPQPTCHGEKHQVTLPSICKRGVLRKSTVPQKYSKNSGYRLAVASLNQWVIPSDPVLGKAATTTVISILPEHSVPNMTTARITAVL